MQFIDIISQTLLPHSDHQALQQSLQQLLNKQPLNFLLSALQYSSQKGISQELRTASLNVLSKNIYQVLDMKTLSHQQQTLLSQRLNQALFAKNNSQRAIRQLGTSVQILITKASLQQTIVPHFLMAAKEAFAEHSSLQDFRASLQIYRSLVNRSQNCPQLAQVMVALIPGLLLRIKSFAQAPKTLATLRCLEVSLQYFSRTVDRLNNELLDTLIIVNAFKNKQIQEIFLMVILMPTPSQQLSLVLTEDSQEAISFNTSKTYALEAFLQFFEVIPFSAGPALLTMLDSLAQSPNILEAMTETHICNLIIKAVEALRRAAQSHQFYQFLYLEQQKIFKIIVRLLATSEIQLGPLDSQEEVNNFMENSFDICNNQNFQTIKCSLSRLIDQLTCRLDGATLRLLNYSLAILDKIIPGKSLDPEQQTKQVVDLEVMNMPKEYLADSLLMLLNILNSQICSRADLRSKVQLFLIYKFDALVSPCLNIRVALRVIQMCVYYPIPPYIHQFIKELQSESVRGWAIQICFQQILKTNAFQKSTIFKDIAFQLSIKCCQLVSPNQKLFCEAMKVLQPKANALEIAQICRVISDYIAKRKDQQYPQKDLHQVLTCLREMSWQQGRQQVIKVFCQVITKTILQLQDIEGLQINFLTLCRKVIKYMTPDLLASLVFGSLKSLDMFTQTLWALIQIDSQSRYLDQRLRGVVAVTLQQVFANNVVFQILEVSTLTLTLAHKYNFFLNKLWRPVHSTMARYLAVLSTYLLKGCADPHLVQNFKELMQAHCEWITQDYECKIVMICLCKLLCKQEQAAFLFQGWSFKALKILINLAVFQSNRKRSGHDKLFDVRLIGKSVQSIKLPDITKCPFKQDQFQCIKQLIKTIRTQTSLNSETLLVLRELQLASTLKWVGGSVRRIIRVKR